MNFIDTVVKIGYIDEGYLPNYPYHMITDNEMIEAFIKEGGFFDAVYPCPDESLRTEYDALHDMIKDRLDQYIASTSSSKQIPNWIYSYMLGEVTTFRSDSEDIEYLYELTRIDPIHGYDVFDVELARACYEVSTEWLKKQSSKSYDRVPTMFGEPHVLKSLRLSYADILATVQ